MVGFIIGFIMGFGLMAILKVGDDDENWYKICYRR